LASDLIELACALDIYVAGNLLVEWKQLRMSVGCIISLFSGKKPFMDACQNYYFWQSLTCLGLRNGTRIRRAHWG
ncbi:hypothetical protein ACJX0J_031178, partial [Zea mays]